MHVLGSAHTDVRVMRAATALAEAGFAVSVVDVECERARPAEEDICGIHMKHLIMPSWYTSRRFKPWFFSKAAQVLILGILGLIQARADIYHAHDVTALPACYIAARLRRKPLIFEAHELPPPEKSVLFGRGLRWLLRHLLAMILPGCAGVITVSPQIAREMRIRYHVPEVTVIRNVPAYRSVPKNGRLRQYLGLSPNVRIALYQGTLQPNRGLDVLVRASLFLEPDIVIVLMGKGDEPTLSQLAELIESEGVADRIKILPAVPYAELLDWTASADIGLNVLPPDYSLSIRWCLPNKLFEYLMAGLPVLTSQLDAVADVIKTHDVGQVVSSLDPAEVGAAITSMLADPGVLARMHLNALDTAREEFNWEKERRHLTHLYLEIGGTPGQMEVLA